MNNCIGLVVVVSAGLMLSACGDGKELGSMPVPVASVRQVDVAQLALGKQTFLEYCVRCHGDEAQGDANWRKRDANGHYPPPPLNGSGHAWHHSKEVLKGMILEGSPQGQGNMPAWKGRLSEEKIDAVIVWFQSLWPQPVYDAWFEMQQRGR